MTFNCIMGNVGFGVSAALLILGTKSQDVSNLHLVGLSTLLKPQTRSAQYETSER